MPTPGQKWKGARESAGLSVQEAANHADVHRNTIYDLEKDDEGVTLRLMNRVAAVYGITLSAIFCDENQVERVPVEFRPLLEPLLPLTQQQRESVIRNVASNLRFMSQMGTANTSTGREKTTSVTPQVAGRGDDGFIDPLTHRQS